VSTHRQQALVDAPLEVVWGLVGSPSRYPEWWPRVIEVRGERFEEGDEYAQVTKNPIGRSESNFLLKRRDNLREIRMSCQLTGMYANWLLTPARAARLSSSYFRRWTNQSLDGLREAARRCQDPC
jgi:hypothetical protein